MAVFPVRTIVLDDVSPVELATIFVSMDSTEQARFFNALAAKTAEWGGLGWCGQCAHMIADLTTDGAKVVTTLADHIQALTARSVAASLEG